MSTTIMYKVTLPEGEHPFASILIDNRGGLHIEYKAPRMLSAIQADEAGRHLDIKSPLTPPTLIERWLHIHMTRDR